MHYIKVAETNELKDGDKKKITLDDKTVLLAKIDGTYYALDNKCPHMGGSLGDGELEGYNIVCPRHGSAFDVRNGRLAKEGKLAFIKVKTKDAKSYPIKIEGNDILIEIG